MIRCKVCGKEYSPKVYELHIKRCKSEKKKEVKQEKSDIEIKLEDLTVKELKELAKEKEIEGYSNMKKDELIKVINEVGD